MRPRAPQDRPESANPSKSGGNMPKRPNQGNRAKRRSFPWPENQASAALRRICSQNTANTTAISSGADAMFTAWNPSAL